MSERTSSGGVAGDGGVAGSGGVAGAGGAAGAATPGVYDPLRLCIFTTVALLTWAFGPWAVAFVAALGLAGYVRARRAGLRRSKCVLRDTRLVIGYLAVVLVAALVGVCWPLLAR